MKKELLINSKENLTKFVESNIKDLNEKSQIFNYELLDFLESKGNQKTCLTEQNIDNFKEVNSSISKNNYHFPDFLRVGNLINYNYSPSKILNNKSFKSEIPFLIPIRDFGIGFFLNSKYKDRINSILELSALKLISSLPNGLCQLSLIDKTGAGQNFPRLSTLHEKFIEGKILSEDNEIELELEGLKNSMSTITQSISANGFESIEEYNKKTDEVPQQYKIICVANFPTGFNKKATENLLSLIQSGPKAGIYVLLTISSNPAFGLNQNINGLTLQDFIKDLTMFEISDRPDEYVSKGWTKENTELFKIPLINEKNFKNLVNNVYSIKFEEENKQYSEEVISILNNKIENINLRPIVDLEKAIPNQLWTKSAGNGVSIPFGKRGIENVYLSLGVNQYEEDESTHHGLICGATGSGKTVFIHDLILQMSLNYHPTELCFYLLDYKEGTEFAIYKDFPYVNILSMEGEIEFGLEVLDKAISLMEKRGALFKEKGVANLSGYNSKVTEEEKLPRIIIIIDEFQVLLPKNQKISLKTNEKLDRILRLGRSFGINLLLATQTLKGIDLDPAILSNMPLRIALRMDEKDSIKIFGEGNNAPKFIKNPGEGIYNKSYGNSKSNIHFQAFRAIDNTVPKTINMILDYINNNLNKNILEKLETDRFVYNGENKANIKNNHLLTKRLEENSTSEDIYIGEPAGLSKEHIKIKFKKDFAENLLIVGHDQIKAISIFYSSILQNSLSHPNAKIYLSNYNSQFEDKLKLKLKNDLPEKLFNDINFSNNKNCELVLEEIYNIFLLRKKNINEEKQDSIFFYQYFLESAKIFNPQGYKDKNIEKLFELLKEGPEYGIHSIYFATDFNTITSSELSRELSKFKKKICLQGGNSLKILGTELNIEFSKSQHIAIINKGEIGEELLKFKPYEIFNNIGETNND